MTTARQGDGKPKAAGPPARLYLPAMPEAPRLARRFTTKTLRAWQVPADAIQSAQIVVSELVTNAHDRPGTAQPISLTLRSRPGRVVIEVTDHDPDPPVLAEPTPDAESGRGLILVRALSEHWGYRPKPSGGKTVYAVIST